MKNTTPPPIDLAILCELLNFVSPECDRDEWTRHLMAAKSEFGDTVKQIMQEWSATASNYSNQGFESTWRSIKAGGGVKIGSLIHAAIENGFKFQPMSQQDKDRLKAEQQARQKEHQQREAEERTLKEQGYRMAKEKAMHFINGLAFLSDPKHQYYQDKSVSELLGSFICPLQFKQSLIVPCYQFKTPAKQHIEYYDWDQMFDLVSLQFIDLDGSKRFLKGGQMKGAFSPLRFGGHIVEVVICEGVSTGITYGAIYNTNADIVCAFNAGNLKAVARAFKIRYPMARIIIAGDNDRYYKNGTPAKVNAGVNAAKEAARAVDGVTHIPEFAPHESGSDWNDRYLLDFNQYQSDEPEWQKELRGYL